MMETPGTAQPPQETPSRQDDDEDDEEEEEQVQGTEAQDEFESKRKKRLELNRKAAQESRRRKKLRIEELQRSVVFLTRENGELREQNDLLRQMLTSDTTSTETSQSVERLQAENNALRLALVKAATAAAAAATPEDDGQVMTAAGLPAHVMNLMARGGAAAAMMTMANTSQLVGSLVDLPKVDDEKVSSDHVIVSDIPTSEGPSSSQPPAVLAADPCTTSPKAS